MASRKAGLSYEDMKHMTVRMVINFIEEFNRLSGNNEENNKPKIRQAEQSDFDNF